jgi:hypothetical protein
MLRQVDREYFRGAEEGAEECRGVSCEAGNDRSLNLRSEIGYGIESGQVHVSKTDGLRLRGALGRKSMKRAAIGLRVHSGWAALVAVANHAGTVEVIERRRVDITVPGTSGAKQPYHFAKQHFAKQLELAEAEKFLGSCLAASKRLAVAALRDVIDELRSREYRVAGVAMLLASGRALPPLPKILASHALIHSAEGEFFRDAFAKACEDLELSVSGFRERELEACVRSAFGKGATRIGQQVSTLGRSIGPPWTTDQKTAALAALIVLGR